MATKQTNVLTSDCWQQKELKLKLTTKNRVQSKAYAMCRRWANSAYFISLIIVIMKQYLIRENLLSRREIKTNMQCAKNTAILQVLTRTTTMLGYLSFGFFIRFLTAFFDTNSARNARIPHNDRINEASHFPHFQFFNYEQVRHFAVVRYSIGLRQKSWVVWLTSIKCSYFIPLNSEPFLALANLISLESLHRLKLYKRSTYSFSGMLLSK